MQYAASLTAIGVLSISLMAAMAAHLASPELMLNPSTWPTPAPQMLRLQDIQKTSPKRHKVEFKTSAHIHHAQCDHDLRSPGKPGADVTLASNGVQTLPVGSPRNVELKLDSHLASGSLRIRLEPSSELELLGAVQEWNFDVKGEQTLVLPITIQADADGQHYVHLFIEHEDGDGNITSRALATEFRVGQSVGNLYAKSFSAQSRREFSALPASEVIY